MVIEVEAGVELGAAQVTGDLAVGAEQVAKPPTAAVGGERAALHHHVGGLPRQTLADQSEQDRFGEEQAARPVAEPALHGLVRVWHVPTLCWLGSAIFPIYLLNTICIGLAKAAVTG